MKNTAAVSKIAAREEIKDEYKWNLELIYPDVTDWESAFDYVKKEIPNLVMFKGCLGEPKKLMEFIELEEKMSLELGKIYVYAHMKSHEDLRIAKFQELSSRAEMLGTEFAEASAFYVPEIIALSDEKIKEIIESEELKAYKFHFEELLHAKKHTLSTAEEELLARAGEIAQVADNAFSMLTDADIKFPVVKDEDGNLVELTEERYYKLSCSKNRNVRKAAFNGLFGTYAKYRNAFGALYQGSVRGDIFYSRSRKYPSALEASLHSDNIPVSVYDNVVNCANENLDAMHSYMKLRKRRLKLKELHLYDLNVPIVDEPKVDIPYDEAVEMVVEGLAPLGEKYVEVLKSGFKTKWVDVFENEGKRKGAYSWGSYGTQPYILLNYNGTMRDVFTIAHEMGHSLHSYWTHSTQPQVYGDYSIFLAEVASTTNEMLLLRHLLAKMPGERPWLLNYGLDMFRTTLYRQAMFAEFERETHALSEKGDVLTPDLLSEIWKNLVQKYHGPDMSVDSAIQMEWARIPHFYSAFYVYKYVTGFVSACSLSSRIIEGEAKKYLEFLGKGSSNWSIEILAEAGVDLRTKSPFDDAVKMLREWLSEWE